MWNRSISSLAFRSQHREVDDDDLASRNPTFEVERMDLTRGVVENDKGMFGFAVVDDGEVEARDWWCSLSGEVSHKEGAAAADAGRGKRWRDASGNCRLDAPDLNRS